MYNHILTLIQNMYGHNPCSVSDSEIMTISIFNKIRWFSVAYFRASLWYVTAIQLCIWHTNWKYEQGLSSF